MLISGYDSIFTKIDEHVDFTNSVYSRIDDFCPCMKLPTISGQKWWYFPEYRWHVLSRTAVNVTICLHWIETSESFLLHFCRRSRNWYGANLHNSFCFSVENTDLIWESWNQKYRNRILKVSFQFKYIRDLDMHQTHYFYKSAVLVAISMVTEAQMHFIRFISVFFSCNFFLLWILFLVHSQSFSQ